VQEKYLRMDRETLGYIVKEEYKRNRLRVKPGREFEDKMYGREDCRILIDCWRKKKHVKEGEREIL
jgi:hypothetical protein